MTEPLTVRTPIEIDGALVHINIEHVTLTCMGTDVTVRRTGTGSWQVRWTPPSGSDVLPAKKAGSLAEALELGAAIAVRTERVRQNLRQTTHVYDEAVKSVLRDVVPRDVEEPKMLVEP